MESLSIIVQFLLICIVATLVFSLPSLWTYRIWLSTSAKSFLHFVSASYAMLWSAWTIGGLKIFFEANPSWFAIFWVLFLLASMNVVAYWPRPSKIKFYLITSLSRFAVLAYLALYFVVIKDPKPGIAFLQLTLPPVFVILLVGYWWGKKRIARMGNREEDSADSRFVSKQGPERSGIASVVGYVLIVLAFLVLLNASFMPIRLALDDLGYGSGVGYWIGIALGILILPLSWPASTLYGLFTHPWEILAMLAWLVGAMG